ncbi:hypothetical protein ATANTOWER_024508 [Ataeniobius toweri]|uniref:Uncharacterized protein n=1 Tax=Ataeniobius toweri TaxID=208326 RepID=A0ABU7B9P7_9TELE|nr:hypothetical protein [Ataeniobius toweri]
MWTLPQSKTCEVYCVSAHGYSGYPGTQRDGELQQSTGSLGPFMTKSEGPAEQKTERQRASSCCSWRRLMLGLLPFFPFTAAITLALNYLTSPPCSVFFLGGSVEFPNLSFSLELTDPTSLQFRLQAQALDHYVNGNAEHVFIETSLNDIWFNSF